MPISGSFRVFDFALHLKLKTWTPRNVFIYFKFLAFPLHSAWERLKPFIEFQINITHVLMSLDTSHNKYISLR